MTEIVSIDFNGNESERLNLDIEGWEGPLDVLLHLARAQKVDLARISILELVEQYLVFIADAKKLRLELAADYLVMAAWLAYLKSCLLLPKEEQEEPSAEELALRLQLRLQRLDAMREAGARLLARDQIGRDVFTRGAPEGVRVVTSATWDCELYDLLKAYGAIKGRQVPREYAVRRRPVFSLEEALDRLESMLGTALDWTVLSSFLPDGITDDDFRRSSVASSFVAALELTRLGKTELSQADSFAPLFLRKRQ
ncbi:segregation and condensation protein A [Sphingosinicella microcystinivorans]|uniref:Segregation and condensation protein A n=1 Tax=Sphingosinicella microcystinivorans TaxID=335406 RepID=A0AAD1G2C5_SPHMI|nr:ScpA family protein [Sphingosinicella microcystinivorans]RKS88051.1 condensin subunit ScpA [Sphingosinicella microcystinivorans]BBE35862.1 segregation/condensation protein A [Sphingosinicella microcystinivorans]